MTENYEKITLDNGVRILAKEFRMSAPHARAFGSGRDPNENHMNAGPRILLSIWYSRAQASEPLPK